MVTENGLYDVAIIGGGTAGIFAAYELNRLLPDKSIVLIERGHSIFNRICPIVAGNASRCVNCNPCAIMNGFGGAGAFSDGKFNFTTEFGGWLSDYMDDAEVMDLIEYVDSVNVKFGATKQRFSTYSDEAKAFMKKSLENDMHLLMASVKHLGTECTLEILKKMFKYLAERIEIRCDTAVDGIERLSDGKYGLKLHGGGLVKCGYLIAAPGRSGAEWFANECRRLGMELINNQVDIGVRVELPAAVFESVTETVYEAKLVYRTKQYGDKVRTFCMNPYGHVVNENVDGCITVNGHSYADPALRSNNTNFALLVSNRFTEPFSEPYRYGKSIASFSNMLGGGVIVQRFR